MPEGWKVPGAVTPNVFLGPAAYVNRKVCFVSYRIILCRVYSVPCMNVSF